MKLLPPIKESSEDWDEIEKKIRELFKKEIYLPLVRELGSKTLQNASSNGLIDALRFGRIQYNRGAFSGRLNSAISRYLKELGAKWDRGARLWRIAKEDLPQEVLLAIQASRAHFESQLQKIDMKLSKLVPEEIAEKLSIERQFNTALWKVDKKFKANVKGVAVAPQLTEEQRKIIADEWQNNMKLWIKGWTEEEIVKLRKSIQETVFAGNRYESAIQTIQASYDVSINKAKFLARQETNLLMSKFKEVRYKAAGINVYQWGCVAGTAAHPVRPEHLKVKGKYFTWDHDYEVDQNGKRKPGGLQKPGKGHDCNPGQDFNCRCFSRAVVHF